MDYGETRPQRRLPDSPYGTRVMEPPRFSSEPGNFHEISLSAFRALYCKFRVFKGDKAYCSFSAPVRHSPYHILGRTFVGSSIHGLLQQHLSTAIWLFISLGFLINIPKSMTSPSHCLEFLGFMVDTHSMTISLPTPKLQGIQKTATRLLHQKSMTVKDLARDVGSYQASSPHRIPTLPCPSAPENSVTTSPPVLPEASSAHGGCQTGSPMVDSQITPSLLEPNNETRSFSGNRVQCLQLRLGTNLPKE